MHVTIVIPARDEVRRIVSAVRAASLSARRSDAETTILVYANNCTDDTAEVARRAAEISNVPVRVIEEALAPEQQNAGYARRRAVGLAFSQLGPDLVVTTDADAMLSRETIAAFVASASTGADVTCGRISTRLPASLAASPSIRRIDAVSAQYGGAVRSVRLGIDLLFARQPLGSRPHYIESGACIAVTAALHRRIGGLPDVPSGEDRALARRAAALGAVVRYSDAAHARVSARLRGRAAGGMAETIRARAADPDPFADEDLVTSERLIETWEAALDARAGGAPAPLMPQADPRLRASVLERELPHLQAFLAAKIAPWLAQHATTRPARNAA